MLPDDQLADLRADLEQLLTDSAQILRATATSDGAGGQTLAWNAVATVKAMLAPAQYKPEERLVADRVTVVQQWVLSVPVSTDIQAADRVLVAGRQYEVVAVLTRSIMFLKRVLLVEMA